VWDPRTAALIEVLPDSGAITTVDYSEDGQILITGGLNGVTRVWSMPGPVWAGPRDAVFTSPFDGSGSRLLAGVGARGGAMMAWNTEDFDNPVLMPELTSRGEDRFTGASALSTDGRLAVGGTGSGTVYLWDLGDPAAPRLVGDPQKYDEGIVGAVVLDPSAKLLAVSSQDDNVFALVDVSDPAAPKLLSSTDAGAYPLMMAFRPDDNILAIANAKNVVDLWDVSDPAAPRVVSTVDGFESYAQAVVFSSDGNVLAAGSADHSIQLWDVHDPSSPRALSRIAGPEGAIYSVAINQKGNQLAAGVSGGSVWLWDISNPDDPQRFAQLTAYPVRVYDAQFAGGSDKIAAAGPDKTIRLWGTDPDAVSARICSSAGTLITEEEWERYLPGVPYRDLCEA
jgi:WD40 repeat protein